MNEAEGLAVIVPSRGRPGAVHDLTHAFAATCADSAYLLFVIDEDDPQADAYRQAIVSLERRGSSTGLILQETGTMVTALNAGARHILSAWPAGEVPTAIGFMGDDHRPRTKGWDAAYLTALAERPGLVYGDDLVQGVRLPTQVAISTQVVRALGHMAPPVLRHMYVDNYWRDLGRAAGCISYLPHVAVEHLHPVAGTADWDDGYRRVNAPEVYGADRAAFEAYMREHGPAEVLAVQSACAGVAR